MLDLGFAIEGVKVERFSASPLLLFALKITSRPADIAILNVMLKCQVRIIPARRRYSGCEHDALSDLFGEPGRWGQTLQSFLWTHASVLVPAFDDHCTVDLPVPCTFDFNVAATKYFHGLEAGDVPLTVFFSGSVFYRDRDGQLQVDQISWSKECSYLLPVAVWRSMMDHYYPGCAWLCVNRDTFEALYRFKRQKGLPSFERALEDLLETRIATLAS